MMSAAFGYTAAIGRMRSQAMIALLATWLVLGMICALPDRVASAAESTVDDESLRGIKSFRVIIEDIERPNAAIEGAGLDESTLRTDTELRLRQAGIRVEWSQSSDAVLYVNLNLHKSTNFPLYIYTVEIEVKQDAHLVRDPHLFVPLVDTWSTGILAVAGIDRIRNAVRENLRDLLDKLINAYLGMNPRR
jgi:hypothetical protein